MDKSPVSVRFVITSQPQSHTLVFKGLGAEPSTSIVRTGALLARNDLDFMRIDFCDILYIGIVYSNPDLMILQLNECSD